jgi:hypothetical protein
LWVSQDNWCTPLVSLHHLSAETLSSLWHWERCQLTTDLERPIKFATLLAWGLPPVAADGSLTRTHWDNGADLKQGGDSLTDESPTICFQACVSDLHCLQASYTEGTCRFAQRLRIGQAVGEEFESFWDVTKLQRLGWQAGGSALASCSEINWLSPKVMLPPKDFLQMLHLKPWP